MAFIARLALVLCLASVVSAQTKVSQPALKGTTALDVYANGDRKGWGGVSTMSPRRGTIGVYSRRVVSTDVESLTLGVRGV